jgi:hypothetical protein
MDTRDGKYCRLPHSVIVKAPGLLPMHYTSKELAEDLSVPSWMVKRWIKNGLPYHRDGHNYIMVDGRELAEWVEAQSRMRKGPRLKAGQGYCMKCNRAVTIRDPIKCRDRKRLILRGVCEVCGSTIYRGIKHGQP